MTPPRFDPAAFADVLAAALDAGDVGAVQLRLPGCGADDLKRAAAALLPVCHRRERPLILDAKPDLALALGCDGVHVGPEPGAVAEARHIVGPHRSVGATSMGSIHLAMEAAEAGADYVSFGPFFRSPNVPAASALADAEVIARWSGMATVPCVAIGGVTPDNCGDLAASGADFVATIGAVWDHPQGPAAAVRAFNDALRLHGPGERAATS